MRIVGVEVLAEEGDVSDGWEEASVENDSSASASGSDVDESDGNGSVEASGSAEDSDESLEDLINTLSSK